MWEEVQKEFKGKVVKGIFQWVNKGTINLTDTAFLISFEDNSQLIISVPNKEKI